MRQLQVYQISIHSGAVSSFFFQIDIRHVKFWLLVFKIFKILMDDAFKLENLSICQSLRQSINQHMHEVFNAY